MLFKSLASGWHESFYTSLFSNSFYKLSSCTLSRKLVSVGGCHRTLSMISQDSINTLRPRQNGRHCADDIFKCILLNENVWIPNKISLKVVPEGPINNIPSLVQIWLGADQATSHYLKHNWLVHWHIYVSLGLNELMAPCRVTACEIYLRRVFFKLICWFIYWSLPVKFSLRVCEYQRTPLIISQHWLR